MPSTQVVLGNPARAAPSEGGLPAPAEAARARLRHPAAGPPALGLERVSSGGCGVPWWTADVPAWRVGFPAAAGEHDTPGRRESAGERDTARPVDARTRPAILVIDDQVRASDELVRLLELEGFAVECAASAAEGLARALARPWDAILLDLHLPDVPGLELLERLTAAGLTCPVIAVTGWYLSEEYEQAALRLGAAAFRFKPLDAEELAGLLREATAGRGVGAAAEGAHGGRPPDALEAGAAGPAATPREQGEPGAADEARAAGLRRLYERLRDGERAALDVLVAALLPAVVDRLRRRFPEVDEHLLNDAAEDALLDLAARPARFDPQRGVPLDDYLFVAAWRNVVDRLRSEGRRRTREAEYAQRTLAGLPRSEADTVETQHDFDALLARLGGSDASEAERRALRLLLEGERSPAALAGALGFSDLPPEIARREAKRWKDRLLKRLRRWWRGRG
jgi:CheY-like chemotaxis protein